MFFHFALEQEDQSAVRINGRTREGTPLLDADNARDHKNVWELVQAMIKRRPDEYKAYLSRGVDIPSATSAQAEKAAEQIGQVCTYGSKVDSAI